MQPAKYFATSRVLLIMVSYFRLAMSYGCLLIVIQTHEDLLD